MQQQPRGLDGVPGDGDRAGALLELLDAAAEVADAGGPAGAFVDPDAADHGVGADLGAVRERVGDVRDERAGFGVDLAALQAEPAVDAVRTVAEPAVGDGDRPDPASIPSCSARRWEDLPVPPTGCGECG